MTKTFTAAAVMQLVQAGKLELSDHIGSFVPGLPWGEKVTIAELVNHTSGVPDYINSVPGMLGKDCPAPSGSMARCPRFGAHQLLSWLARQPLQFAPGTQWSYSSSGYYLLGLVIEKLSGQSYGSYLATHILRPLGLAHTSMCPDSPHPPKLAVGYISSPITRQWASVGEGGIPASDGFAAGELCSTGADLVRFMEALAQGRVVSPASYTEMTAPARLVNGSTYPYGFGLILPSPEGFLGPFPGQPYLGHTGGQPGFTSVLVHFPKLDLNIALLLNNSGPGPASIGYVIAYGVVCRLLHQSC
jgi:D-alanyl-D-alanine carboxypeptidase